MDRFLDLIVAGDITPKTKEALLKQLNEQTALVVPALRPEAARMNDSTGGEMMDEQRPLRPRQQGQQLARTDEQATGACDICTGYERQGNR